MKCISIVKKKFKKRKNNQTTIKILKKVGKHSKNFKKTGNTLTLV